MPDDGTPSAEVFDDVFAQVSRAPRANELFDQVLGPFPAGVEPFSLVPRQGLDRVLAELRLRPGDHLLDLCCGRGGVGLWFASASGARLTGADFSAAAISQASRRAAGFTPRPRASFIVADAADTGLAAGTVDAVACIDSLQFVPDKDAVLREIARVLRPGGRLVVTTWERRHPERADLPEVYSIADAAALAAAAGLRVLVREERADWQEMERAFYQRVIAEDSEQAEPAVRLLAGEGRALLPHSASVRRLLLVAGHHQAAGEIASLPVAVASSRAEAELIVGMLRANGLRAVVSADDAGGLEPQLQLQGVRVLVPPSEEAAARQLLAASDDTPS